MRENRTYSSMRGRWKRNYGRTEAPTIRRKPSETATPRTYGHRASVLLYYITCWTAGLSGKSNQGYEAGRRSFAMRTTSSSASR
jgi:hypothetical protein